MGDLEDRARLADEDDPLSSFRERFDIDDGLIYLDGNSLGPMPRSARGRVGSVMDEWARDLVMGWDRWIDIGTRLGDLLAPIIGAGPGEVAVADQTSVNLYKLASAALDASDRPSIMTDAGNFPSDLYVLSSVAAAHGGELVVVPEDPTPNQIEDALDDRIALLALTHVGYRSGFMHDGSAITALAHGNGSRVLWDLAHSAGSTFVALDDWGADLAVGCTYKYLNGGPGSPGFLYVRGDLQSELVQPIAGWFGHVDMFAFEPRFVPAPSISRFLVGTPPVVSMAATEVGIEITAEAGIPRIRAKSLAMSNLFIDAVTSLIDAGSIGIVGPPDPDRRGSHVALRHPDGYGVSRALRAEGVIVDFRAPDIVRFGFAPLFNTHRQVLDAVERLTGVLDARSFEQYRGSAQGVT